MRLIDADALMEKSFEIEYADGWHKSVTKEVVSVRDIDNAPTIEPNGIGRYEKAMQTLRDMPKYFNGIKAKQIKKIQSDTVEVVRCEKCKHYSVEGFTTLFGWCNAKEHPTDEDDYCKYGERKE